jgi:hypothetical protein
MSVLAKQYTLKSATDIKSRFIELGNEHLVQRTDIHNVFGGKSMNPLEFLNKFNVIISNYSRRSINY